MSSHDIEAVRLELGQRVSKDIWQENDAFDFIGFSEGHVIGKAEKADILRELT